MTRITEWGESIVNLNRLSGLLFNAKTGAKRLDSFLFHYQQFKKISVLVRPFRPFQRLLHPVERLLHPVITVEFELESES